MGRGKPAPSLLAGAAQDIPLVVYALLCWWGRLWRGSAGASFILGVDGRRGWVYIGGASVVGFEVKRVQRFGASKTWVSAAPNASTYRPSELIAGRSREWDTVGGCSWRWS